MICAVCGMYCDVDRVFKGVSDGDKIGPPGRCESYSPETSLSRCDLSGVCYGNGKCSCVKG